MDSSNENMDALLLRGHINVSLTGVVDYEESLQHNGYLKSFKQRI